MTWEGASAKAKDRGSSGKAIPKKRSGHGSRGKRLRKIRKALDRQGRAFRKGGGALDRQGRGFRECGSVGDRPFRARGKSGMMPRIPRALPWAKEGGAVGTLGYAGNQGLPTGFSRCRRHRQCTVDLKPQRGVLPQPRATPWESDDERVPITNQSPERTTLDLRASLAGKGDEVRETSSALP
jgi:hypothetical protein